MSSPDVKNDVAPKWASNSQRVFLMGRAIHALTGCAARHENTEIYFLGRHFPKKSSLGIFATNEELGPNRCNWDGVSANPSFF